jgi:ATP-dependent protease ClpP protease subunit
MNHDNLMLLPKPNRVYSKSIPLNEHVIKIWGDITEPEDWVEEILLIEDAQESDVIILDLCTGGGFTDTAMLFERALRTTQAKTVARIGPTCASAGSIIALACSSWELDDTSELMAHTGAYGISGKDVDILEHANFARQQMHRLFQRVYSGFLTQDEIADIIKGTPMYFNSEAIAERLDNLMAYREEQESGCEDPECNTCCSNEEDSPSLTGMIEDSVELGVKKALDSILKKYNLVEKPVAEKKPSAKLTKAMKEAVIIAKNVQEFNEMEFDKLGK